MASFLRRLALALNTALDMASAATVTATAKPGQGAGAGAGGGGAGGGGPGAERHAASTRQRVYGVTLVKGTPFYGFHAGERLWAKILM